MTATHPLVARMVASCQGQVAWRMAPQTDLPALCAVLWGHQMRAEQATDSDALYNANHTVMELAHDMVAMLRRHVSPRAASALCAQVSCQLAREQGLDADAHRLLLRHLATDQGATDLDPATMRQLLQAFAAPGHQDWELDE